MTRRQHTSSDPSRRGESISPVLPRRYLSPSRIEIAEIEKTPTAATFDSITRFYSFVHAKNDEWTTCIPYGCFALKLARLIIQLIAENAFRIGRGGSFDRAFYRICEKKAAACGLLDEIGDREIFIIYIKQCLHILEGAGILSRKGKHASIRSFVDDDQTLFPRLLHSFWNITPWESIFPSDVEAAKDLQERRSFLKDAILMNPGVSRIDRIANTFFDMTGFSSRGNLFTISFIDFYPLTWLKHFGLLQYIEGHTYEPVRVALTKAGSIILRTLA